MAYLLKELFAVVPPKFAWYIHRWLDSADSLEDSQNNDGSLGTILQQMKDALEGLFAESVPVVTESYISTLFGWKESAPVVRESYISTLFGWRESAPVVTESYISTLFGWNASSVETENSWWDPAAIFKAAVAAFNNNFILPALASLGFVLVLTTVWWHCKQRRCPESRSNEILPGVENDIKFKDTTPVLDYATSSKERAPEFDNDVKCKDNFPGLDYATCSKERIPEFDNDVKYKDNIPGLDYTTSSKERVPEFDNDVKCKDNIPGLDYATCSKERVPEFDNDVKCKDNIPGLDYATCSKERIPEFDNDVKYKDNIPGLDYATSSKERIPEFDDQPKKGDKIETGPDSFNDSKAVLQQGPSRDLDKVSVTKAAHGYGHVSASSDSLDPVLNSSSEGTALPNNLHNTSIAPAISIQAPSKRSATLCNGPSRAQKSDSVSAAPYPFHLTLSHISDTKKSALTPHAAAIDFPDLTVNPSKSSDSSSASVSSFDIIKKVPSFASKSPVCSLKMVVPMKMVVPTPTSILKVSRETSCSSLSLSGSIIVAEDTLAPFALAPSYNVGQLIPGHAQNLEILAILGRGNQAALYKVSDGISSFAAKITHSDDLLKDLILEFDILIALKHPNVVKVHDRLPRGFLMDCLSQDLQSFIDSSGHVVPKIRDRLSLGILEGVDFIHDSGIAHLDIKPNNILLTACGVPKLCDFGLAVKYRNDDGTMLDLESYHGTPHYVSPEMFRKAIFVSDDVIDLPKSDCWSAGVTLFQILSGQVLFAGKTEIEVFHNQRCNNYNYPPFLSGLTPVDTDYYYFMEMVKGLCKNNPSTRLSARQAISHKCFKILEEMSV